VTVAAIVLAAVLAVAAVVFVARPFLRHPEAEDAPRGPDADAVERLRLVEERDRALAALKELEFDHRTGKISDADYQEQLGSLRREAAETLRALDGTRPPAQARLRGGVGKVDDPQIR
jgi:hypothetical protein